MDCGCFFFFVTTNKTSHLVLRDEAVGLHGLFPLEEDHVVERGEGQGLRSDAARNCSGREREKKTTCLDTNTLLGLLELMDSRAGHTRG